MPSTVAVAHYPEGAGHATRMLAIAKELEEHGAEVLMAGGGAGTDLVSLNGYDEFEPTTVDYIDTYQSGSLRAVVTKSLPASRDRVTDYVRWLRETNPDALVTDDMFAAMAASRTDTPLYVLKHDAPGLYSDPLERAGATFHTAYQLSAAREFFYPAVWPSSEVDPENATRIPPVALDDDGREIDAADVVVVPSYYSDLGWVADHLERRGYDVLHVGDDDWEPVASLLPYIRGADIVVCSGYSTIMDAAVAETPCVIYPATDEQRAVADWIDRFDLAGFTVADDRLDVIESVTSPLESPAYDNGAEVVARTVLEDLQQSDETEPAVPRTGAASPFRQAIVGRTKRAATTVTASLVTAGVVAQTVAAQNAYTAIERSLPTYAGAIHESFVVFAVLLVAMAALASVLDAGVVSSVLLASGPVVGWAVNHWTATAGPHYAVTFPIEMAVLYGGAFGTIGYLLGRRLQDVQVVPGLRVSRN